jgi:hypothetical protein
MNARAIKTRIRDRLRQQKFKIERLECSYRHVINGKLSRPHCEYVLNNHPERKLSQQTETSVKRREPGISKLAKTYNDYCNQLQAATSTTSRPNVDSLAS